MKARHSILFACLCSLLSASPVWAGWSNVSSSVPISIVAGQGSAMYGIDSANVYSSSDSGKTWQTIIGPAIGPNTSLAFFNNQMWVGSTALGVAYSADSGKSWTKTSNGMVNFFTKKIEEPINVLASLNTSTILAAPFLSADGGGNWKISNTGLPDNPSTCFAGACRKYPIIVATTAASAFLVGTDVGVYRSADGTAWSASGLSSNKVGTLVAKGALVYAGVVSGAPGLYKSTDGGSNWTLQSSFSGAPSALAIHPSKDGVVFAGTSAGKVFTSNDGGATWTDISDTSVSGSVAALAVPADQDGALVAATGSGIFRYVPDVPVQPSFTIPEVTRAPRDTAIVSQEITVSGLVKPEAISVSGGEYSVNGRAFTSVPGLVVNGAKVRVRVQSSTSFDTATSATLTIGQQSAIFKVTTIKQTVITSLTQVLQTTNPNVSLVNGVVQVTGTPTTPIQLSGTAPSNAIFQLPQNTPVQVQSGTQTLTYTDVTGSSQLSVQPLTTSQTGLQVSSGTFNIQSSTSGVVPVGSSSTGTVSTLTTSNTCQTNMLVARTGSQTSAFVETCKVTYGSGGTSGGSGFAASTGVDVYGGETAELNDTGSLQMVRIGSLNGDKSLPGDPANLTTGLTVDPDTKVPNLTGNLQRLNNAASLIDVIQTALNAQFGVTTGKATYDAASGVVTYVVNGKTYRFIPLGSPLISINGGGGNGFKAASAASTASGSFSLASQGIQITLAGTFGYFNDLNTSLKAFDANAKVRLRSSGAFQISLGGTEYVCAPGTASSGGGATPVQTPGFQINNNGLITFTDSYGALQVLYPAFADSNVANQTTKSVDAAGTFVDNGDGTSTMTISGQSFKLKPDYSLSAVPSAHSSESWWVDGTKVYLRYNDDNAAQSMTVN